MNRGALTTLLSLFLIFTLYAQEEDTLEVFDGTLGIRYANEFNRIPLGCRANAMGNTGAVLPYSDFASFWNPAIAAFDEKFVISVEGAKLYGGLSSLGALYFMAPVQAGVVAGLNYAAFFPGSITQWDTIPGTYDEVQQKQLYSQSGYGDLGVFHNNKHRITATVAKNFTLPVRRSVSHAVPMPVDIAIGLNIKALWETMTPDDDVRMGMNINMDLGIALRLGVDYDFKKKRLKRELLIALSWIDLLPTKMQWLHSWENYEEETQSFQHYGIAYIDRSGFLKGNWTVALGLQKQYDVSVHAGLEGEFFDIVAFRVGLSDKIATLGCGVHYKRYSLDYSFSFDELHYSPLRLTAGVRF